MSLAQATLTSTNSIFAFGNPPASNTKTHPWDYLISVPNSFPLNATPVQLKPAPAAFGGGKS